MRHSQKICSSSVQTVSYLFWEEISLFNVILDIISFLLFPVSRMSQPAPMSPKFLLAISEFQGLNLYLWPICGLYIVSDRGQVSIFFMMIYSFPRHVYQKPHFFPFSGCFWNFCEDSTGCRCVGSSVDSCSVLLVFTSVVIAIPNYIGYCGSVVYLEIIHCKNFL